MGRFVSDNPPVFSAHPITIQEVWLYDQQGPYLNPAIIQTIKNAWFGSGKTIGNNHPEAYISSLPDRQDEKELLIALVALAVTTVRLV